jgi:hypothetical protein
LLAFAPDGGRRVVAGRRGGELDGHRQGQGVHALAAQIGGALEDHARLGLLVRRQRGVEVVGVAGVRAEGDARLGRRLLVVGQQGDHVAGGGALRAIQQDVGAADVVVAGQQRRRSGPACRAGRRVRTPGRATSGESGWSASLVRPRPGRRGQGHGALGRLRVAPPNQAIIRWASRPEVDQGLLGGVLAALARGQPDRSRRAWSSSKKLMLSAPASTSAHRAILRDSGSWMLSIAMRMVAGSRLVTAMRRLAASASAGVA